MPTSCGQCSGIKAFRFLPDEQRANLWKSQKQTDQAHPKQKGETEGSKFLRLFDCLSVSSFFVNAQSAVSILSWRGLFDNVLRFVVIGRVCNAFLFPECLFPDRLSRRSRSIPHGRRWFERVLCCFSPRLIVCSTQSRTPPLKKRSQACRDGKYIIDPRLRGLFFPVRNEACLRYDLCKFCSKLCEFSFGWCDTADKQHLEMRVTVHCLAASAKDFLDALRAAIRDSSSEILNSRISDSPKMNPALLPSASAVAASYQKWVQKYGKPRYATVFKDDVPLREVLEHLATAVAASSGSSAPSERGDSSTAPFQFGYSWSSDIVLCSSLPAGGTRSGSDRSPLIEID